MPRLFPVRAAVGKTHDGSGIRKLDEIGFIGQLQGVMGSGGIARR